MSSRRKFLKLISVAPVAAQFLQLKSIAQIPAPQEQLPQTHSADINQNFPPQLAGSPVGDPLPGQKWRVHDRSRPQARKVAPGLPIPEVRPPSDSGSFCSMATDLSQWAMFQRDGQITDPKWRVENGCIEMVPHTGNLMTKQAFGDCQLHLEWMTPTGADSSHVGQMRGNSGVILMKRYEIQVYIFV